ncbi:MAG: DUF3999 family protein [Propionivibrio sp.]
MIDMLSTTRFFCLAAIFVAFGGGAVHAAEPRKSDIPADYAYALPLQVSGQQGVVAYTLPLSIYLKARTAGLDDLRVFDAKGVAQPFAVHRPSPEPPAHRDSLPATVFPVHGSRQSTGNDAIDVDIRTRSDGSVVSVQTRAGKAASGGEAALTGLILDFGATAGDTVAPRIEALRFAAPKGQSNYNAEVWLEASNDLKHWDTIGAAELGWLANEGGQTLTNDRLEFSAQRFRYARLSWKRGTPIEFAAITAETVPRQEREPQRETLWLKPQAGREAGDLVYPVGVALPVEQISLNFSEANIVYPLTLGEYVERPTRRGGTVTEWVFQPRTRATFYQITQGGQTRRSGPLNIGSVHQAEWVLRPQNPQAGAQPELGLSWQPATLVFLAGGTPPHTLSFGSADAKPAARPLDEVAPGFSADELQNLEQAKAGEMRTVAGGGGAADSDALLAVLSARTRSYILWGVLLLGVALLAGLAWRLLRQMKGEGQGSE